MGQEAGQGKWGRELGKRGEVTSQSKDGGRGGTWGKGGHGECEKVEGGAEAQGGASMSGMPAL